MLSTFIGVEISVGPCSNFDVVDFFVDCVTATCDLDLTSAATTANQSICFNDPIVDITYAATGDATSINATGLPTGLTAVYNAGVLTISGTPTVSGQFTYNVTTTGNSCTAATTSGVITVGVGNNTISYSNGTSGSVCGTANEKYGKCYC